MLLVIIVRIYIYIIRVPISVDQYSLNYFLIIGSILLEQSLNKIYMFSYNFIKQYDHAFVIDISENTSFSSPDDPNKIDTIEKSTNLEDLDGIPIVYQVIYIYLNFGIVVI